MASTTEKKAPETRSPRISTIMTSLATANAKRTTNQRELAASPRFRK